MDITDFSVFKAKLASQAANAAQNFNIALLNLRGSLQKEWTRQDRQQAQQGIDPTQVASFKVCGPSKLEAHVVKHNPKLQQLSKQCFAGLVEHIHSALLETKVAQGLYEQLRAKSLAVEIAGDDKDSLSFAALTRDICGQMNLNVGMSGGADSTLVLVLACALRDKYGYGVRAIHCIHGLDPDDEIWLQHNRDLCERLQVELHTPVLNIVYGAGLSPEDISRQERYRALLELTNPETDCLLLGHQADDQIENFLLALKRGSGPQGLAGMRLLTEDERGCLVRPLLELHKVELEQILTDLDFNYVYDLSNGYLKFERNFIRLKVLPVLRQRFAGIDKAVLRSQRLCAFEHDLASRYVQMQAEQFLTKVSYAPFTALDSTHLDLSDSAFVTLLIRHFLSTTLQEQGFKPSIDYNLVERCYELLLSPHDANGCLKVLGTPYVASTFLHYLCLYEPFTAQDLAACTAKHYLKEGETLQLGAMSYSLEKVEPEELLADAALQGKVFRIPQPQQVPSQAQQVSAQTQQVPCVCLDFTYTQGLKIKPRLRQHSREIKKLFVEYQIAPWLRKTVPLVKAVPATISQAPSQAQEGMIEDKATEILALGDILATGQGRADFNAGLTGYYRLNMRRVK